jgi:hypothetical protein
MAITVSLLILTTIPHALGQDDLKGLQRQVTELREQLNDLRRELADLKRGMRKSDTSSPSDSAEDRKSTGENVGKIIGAVWELDVLKPDGSVFATTKYYAANGKLFFNEKEVGSYRENLRENWCEIEITKNVPERHIGTAKLRKIVDKPAKYAGKFLNKQGENPSIRIRIVED